MAARSRIMAEQKDRIRRMKWWHEAKFGMFIHWGLYSVIGRHEWVKEIEAIPLREYEPLARRFKPRPNAARACPPRRRTSSSASWNCNAPPFPSRTCSGFARR